MNMTDRKVLREAAIEIYRLANQIVASETVVVRGRRVYPKGEEAHGLEVRRLRLLGSELLRVERKG